MGKKNRRSQKSDRCESQGLTANPFGDLSLPDLPVHTPAPIQATRSLQKGVLRLRIEKKGRCGKTVTVIDGVEGDGKELASRLKRSLGIGGSQFEGTVELQGDCREKVAGLLRNEGFTVKGVN